MTVTLKTQRPRRTTVGESQSDSLRRRALEVLAGERRPSRSALSRLPPFAHNKAFSVLWERHGIRLSGSLSDYKSLVKVILASLSAQKWEPGKLPCATQLSSTIIRARLSSKRRLHAAMFLQDILQCKKAFNKLDDTVKQEALLAHRESMLTPPVPYDEAISSALNELGDHLFNNPRPGLRPGPFTVTSSPGILRDPMLARAVYEGNRESGGALAHYPRTTTLMDRYGAYLKAKVPSPLQRALTVSLFQKSLGRNPDLLVAPLQAPRQRRDERTLGPEVEQGMVSLINTPNVGRVIAVPDKGKFRVLTAMRASSKALKPVQERLRQGLLQFREFALTGRTITSEDVSWIDSDPDAPTGSEFISGDYDAATDGIPHWVTLSVLDGATKGEVPLTRAAIKSEMGPCHLVYPDGSTIVNRRGQLMGTLLSFPVLCAINFGAFRSVFPNRRVLINGDDILFKGTRAEFEKWSRRVADFGLTLNKSKTIVHPDIANMNSQTFVRISGGHMALAPGFPFASMVSDDLSTAALFMKRRPFLREALQLRRFLRRFHPVTQVMDPRPWFSPVALGGAGLWPRPLGGQERDYGHLVRHSALRAVKIRAPLPRRFVTALDLGPQFSNFKDSYISRVQASATPARRLRLPGAATRGRLLAAYRAGGTLPGPMPLALCNSARKGGVKRLLKAELHG